MLIQQAHRRKLAAHAAPIGFTNLGKDAKCLSVSGYVTQGKIKINVDAFHKVAEFKGSTKNHLLAQVTGFRVGDPDAPKRADDCLDTFVDGIAIALGDRDGN